MSKFVDLAIINFTCLLNHIEVEKEFSNGFHSDHQLIDMDALES